MPENAWRLNDSAPVGFAQEFAAAAGEWTPAYWGPALLAFEGAGSAVATVTGAGGVASRAAVGQPGITPRAAVIGAGGVASPRVVGQPAVVTRAAVGGAGAVPSTRAVGQPTVTTSGGTATVTGAGGVATRAAVGQPAVSTVSPAIELPGGAWARRRVVDTRRPPYAEIVGAGGVPSRAAVGRPTVASYRRAPRLRRAEEILLMSRAA